MKNKAKFFLLLAVLAIVFSAVACKKETDTGGYKEKEFEIQSLVLWGQDILGKSKITLPPDGEPKYLKIEISNCDEYTVHAGIDEAKYLAQGKGGVATIGEGWMVMPTTFKLFRIIIKGNGFAKKTINLEVKRDVTPAPGLAISVVRKGAGESEVPLTQDGQVVTTKGNTAEIKIVSPNVEMLKVEVDDLRQNLSEDKKSALIYVNTLITGVEIPKTVKIKYKYHANVSRKFKIKKE